MKLEELLGAELYAQVKAKIDEANKDEDDKLKHIRYADLSEGEYVGKGKHDALQTKFDLQSQELTAANELITQLKKDGKGNEEMQGKTTAYEEQVIDLQQQLAETKLNSAIKIALLAENVEDADYLAFKLKEKANADGGKLELDENDNIKGWDKMLEGLKTQCPTMFKTEQQKKIEEKRLPGEQSPGGESDPKTLEDALRMAYETNE